MIGQFGVGFYSAFMVSDQVSVESRRADGDEGWRWESDGLGEYTIGPSERTTRGTTVTLHIKKDAKDYLKPDTLRGHRQEALRPHRHPGGDERGRRRRTKR